MSSKEFIERFTSLEQQILALKNHPSEDDKIRGELADLIMQGSLSDIYTVEYRLIKLL